MDGLIILSYDQLYYRLPYFLKPGVVSGHAFLKKREKYGRFFRDIFSFLLSSSVDEQSSKAEEELRFFLSSIRKKRLFYEIPSDLDIREIPIIDKSIVLQNYDQLLQEKPYYIGKSSGTTGQPLAIPFSMQAYQKEYAFWWYHRSFGGVTRGEKVATIAGHKVIHVNTKKPPFWVMNHAENQLFFSSYHLSNENLRYYIKALNRFKPTFIHGYPSSIYLLAHYISENEINLEFQPKMIVTASETTLDFQKRAIENAFRCKNYIWYGNTECCGHITECPRGKLHIQPYHSFVRIVDEQGNDVQPGEEGCIAATNFTNMAFPLINYNIKDVVRLSREQDCSCGKGGRVVDYVVGRIEDYIVTPEGRLVGRLDHLFKNAKYVRSAQVEQKAVNEVIIRIEKEEKFSSEIERVIYDEARSRLGDKIQIVFDYVDEIPKDTNGKFRFIVQNLKIRNVMPESSTVHKS